MIVVIRYVVNGQAELLELPTARVTDAEELALLGILIAPPGATSVEVGHWSALPGPPVPSAEQRQALGDVAELAGWPDLAKAFRVQGASARPAARAVVDRALAGALAPPRRAALERLREIL